MTKLTARCVGQDFPIEMKDGGIDSQGMGEAVSLVLQINVNEDAKPKDVMRVTKDSDGLVEIDIAEGFRIVDGKAEIDPVNQYPKGVIGGNLRINFIRLGQRKAMFVVDSLSGKNGTVNVRFFIKYTKIVP